MTWRANIAALALIAAVLGFGVVAERAATSGGYSPADVINPDDLPSGTIVATPDAPVVAFAISSEGQWTDTELWWPRDLDASGGIRYEVFVDSPDAFGRSNSPSQPLPPNSVGIDGDGTSGTTFLTVEIHVVSFGSASSLVIDWTVLCTSGEWFVDRCRAQATSGTEVSEGLIALT